MGSTTVEKLLERVMMMMNSRFDKIDERFDKVENFDVMNKRLTKLEENFDVMSGRVARIDVDVKNMQKQLTRVEDSLDFMSGEFETLKQVSSDSTTQVNDVLYD